MKVQEMGGSIRLNRVQRRCVIKDEIVSKKILI